MAAAGRNGRRLFLIQAGVFAFCLLLMLVSVAMADEGIIPGAVLMGVLFAAVLIQTYKGYGWARWVLAISQLLLSALCILSAAQAPFLLALGIPLLACGATLLFVPAVKEFLASQRPAETGVEEASAEIVIGDETLTGTSQQPAQPTIDYRRIPSLLKRVQAAFVDALLPLFTAFMLAALLPGVADWPPAGKLALVGICFLYEPILSSFSLTLGQRLTGTRVRRHAAQEQHISLPVALGRFVTKFFLGWLSYLTIHFNPERRALHDLVAGTVVLRAGAPKPEEV